MHGRISKEQYIYFANKIHFEEFADKFYINLKYNSKHIHNVRSFHIILCIVFRIKQKKNI